MNLKTLRLIFSACADDTRLRIINLLQARELTVSQICFLLDISQPSVSKHLAKLRLLKLVADKRKGNMVYYNLNSDRNSPQGKVVAFILSQFKTIQTFQRDKKKFPKNK